MTCAAPLIPWRQSMNCENRHQRAFWSISSRTELKGSGRSFRTSNLRGTIALLTSLLVFLALVADPARAQDEGKIARGDAAVTGFSGSLTAADVPKDIHPLDVTFINPDGPVLQVFDLSQLGGAPADQLVDVPVTLEVKASEIGQVFGVTLDSAKADKIPNIYVAATSLFGLQIVRMEDGKAMRLADGGPGAQWMPGQFGTEAGGGPGSIWKIDGTTGEVSLFANVMSGPNPNAGPGLGALAYDPVSNNIYVANLETGFIHRIDLEGHDTGVFDHGTQGRTKAGLNAVAYDPSKRMDIENPAFKVEDPTTWGYADKQRLVFALAISKDRLYYSVAAGPHMVSAGLESSVAEGPQVWSVGLDQDGGFLDDARLEIDVKDTPSGGLITGIAFDGPDKIYLTQRGDAAGSYEYAEFAKPQSSVVRRYTWDDTEQRWVEGADEFAVGLTPPYRATNGGVALGYGYDSSGKVDFGKCGATLWATGEFLRGGTDPDQVVDGLQAISTESGQPVQSLSVAPEPSPSDGAELSPPKEAWFTDTNGNDGDERSAGHIGSIAIFAPCDNEIAEAERPEPLPDSGYPSYPDYNPSADVADSGLPSAWPQVMPGLSITKTCTPAPVGTKEIDCTITVTNTGTVPLTDPIVFSDSTTGLNPGAGGGTPVAGAPVSLASVSPDAAAWTCTPAPTINLSCSLPPDELPPGSSHSVTVAVDTSGFIASGTVGFHNCASLSAPYWGEACADGGMDITVTKTAPTSCAASSTCPFTVTVANNGTQAFNGPVQLGDLMWTIPGGSSAVGGGPLSTPVPVSTDLPCATAPSTLPFSCGANLSLAPGEARSYAVTVTMPAHATSASPGGTWTSTSDYWAKNCFVAAAPGASTLVHPGDPTTGGSVGSGGALSCVWVKVGNPPPSSNLALKKVPKIDPTTGRACAKSPDNPDDVRCGFTVTVENTGPSDFTDPLQFTDSLTDTTPAPLAGARMEPTDAAANGCAPTGPLPSTTYLCTPPPQPIPAGGRIEMDYHIDVPRTALVAAGCRIRNEVALNLSRTPQNTQLGDDIASVAADAYLLHVNEDRSVAVLCDPPDLKVTKTSTGDCKKSGKGYKCAFRVKVENIGPDPYIGDIGLKDSIHDIRLGDKGGRVWVTARTSSPLKCPDGSVLACHIPPPANGTEWPTLAAHHSYTVDVTVEIPDVNQCSLTNTAELTYPAANTLWNKIASDDKASATSKIPNPKCKKKVCTPGDGEFRTLAGDCACKAGYARDNNGRCDPVKVVEVQPPETPKPTEVARCPDSYPIPRSGVCPCAKGKWNKAKNKCEDESLMVSPGITPQDEIEPRTLDCWSGWSEIGPREAKSYIGKGYKVRPRRERDQTIWCARKENTPPPPPPTLDCWSGWKKIGANDTKSFSKDGYKVRQRSEDGQTIWCALKERTPPVPPSGPDTVPERRCKQVWKDVCTVKPVRDCHQVTDNNCKLVPKQDCHNVTKQICEMRPEQNCRNITTQKCSMRPKSVCRTVKTNKCRKVPQRFCGTGEFAGCVTTYKQVCGPVNEKVCTNSRQKVCIPVNKRVCSKTMRRVCRPVNKRVCKKRMQRVCSHKTRTECPTVQKRTCTRKRETVCK
jgi:hypothetical protein